MMNELENSNMSVADETQNEAIIARGDFQAPQVKGGFSFARDWQSLSVLAAAVGACLWGLFAPLGAGWGLWDWTSGLKGLTWSFGLAAFALVIGSFAIWRDQRKGVAKRLLLWLGTAIALIYAGWLGSLVVKARSVPAIHDVSTDLADPPQMAVLKIRADNMDTIPGADDADMKGMSPLQRWTKLHQEAYGDIRAVRMAQPMTEVMAKAERLAKKRGWYIAVYSPAEGRLEATATSALFRFKDDVVLRVRPTEDNTGSIVDMRSISRVGQSDLGVNAERIKSFLADLSGTIGAAQ
jgi:hypothetical protein